MLYKYRSWEDELQRRWITIPEVYFSSIEDFNDPFDSSLRYRYEDLSPEEQRQAIRRSADQQLTDEEVEERWENSAFANPELFDEHFEDLILPMINDRFGILSLTPNYDNLLMWSHYANSHRGFCIGYSDELRERLRFNHFAADDRTFIDLHEVRYRPDYPSVNPLELDSEEYSFHLLTVKSEDWEYEEEQRLISMPRTGFASQISTDLIQEVHLGCKMPEETVEQIVELRNEQMPNTNIFRAQKSNTSFELTFEQIAG